MKELEHEPTVPELTYIRYNPKTAYNQGRTESPIKIIPFDEVPEEPEDVQIRNSQPELNSFTPPLSSLKNVRNQQNISLDNRRENSFANHCEALPRVRYNDLSRCTSSGNTMELNIKEPDSDPGENKNR